MMPVRLEPAAPLSLVKHSTTEPLRSHVTPLWNSLLCSCTRVANESLLYTSSPNEGKLKAKQESEYFEQW